LEKFARDYHSSLLRKSVNFGQKVLTLAPGEMAQLKFYGSFKNKIAVFLEDPE